MGTEFSEIITLNLASLYLLMWPKDIAASPYSLTKTAS